MRLHNDLIAVSPRGRAMAKLLNHEAAQDGAYARVVPLTAFSVLKATSCDKTNALFERLFELGKTGTVPAALPAVLKRHGPCLKMTESDGGAACHVWEVERLFGANQATEQTQARILGRRVLAKYKPDYSGTVVRLVDRCQEALSQALRDESQELQGTTWLDSARLMAAMASRTEDPLRASFVFLERFVREEQAEIDLLQPSNILQDMFGRPVLSDPVAGLASPFSAPAEDAGFCAWAEVPVGLLPGFKVQLEVRSSLNVEKATALLVADRIRALGLACTVGKWGDVAHQAALHQAPRVEPLWHMPKAAELLRNSYLKDTLLTC